MVVRVRRVSLLKISELTRLIAGQLILIHAENSAVNPACACRSFEEPILSMLWETQSSLYTLLGVEQRRVYSIYYKVL